MRKTLLLGAGRDRSKKLYIGNQSTWDGELVTLDMDPNSGADFIWDLEKRPLPFADEEFDELAAYDVLEHVGRQGDWRDFFDQFAEYWRILKPGGLFGIIVPIGEDAFCDPGHSRFYAPKHFYMLAQRFYAENPGGDYRWYWKRSFEVLHMQEASGPAPIGKHHLSVYLRKD